MSNEQMHDLIEEFKKDAKSTGNLGGVAIGVMNIVMDTFYVWFANRKLK